MTVINKTDTIATECEALNDEIRLLWHELTDKGKEEAGSLAYAAAGHLVAARDLLMSASTLLRRPGEVQP